MFRALSTRGGTDTEAAQEPQRWWRAKSEDELDPARIRTQELECYEDP